MRSYSALQLLQDVNIPVDYVIFSFTESLSQQRLRPRQNIIGPRAIDPESEYLCPLCKRLVDLLSKFNIFRLSNCALPLLPVTNLLHVERFSEGRPRTTESYEEWIAHLTESLSVFTKSPAAKKTHSRKRSHSERSLADLSRRDASAALDSSLSSSVSALEYTSGVESSPEGANRREDRSSVPANFPLSDNEEEHEDPIYLRPSALQLQRVVVEQVSKFQV